MSNAILVRRRVVLNVPYREKDEAKKLGARWDPECRTWFVPAGFDTLPFSRWLPPAEDEALKDDKAA